MHALIKGRGRAYAILLGAVLCLLSSCQPTSFTSESDYLQWALLPESGCAAQSARDGVQFQLIYLPELASDAASEYLRFALFIRPENPDTDVLEAGFASASGRDALLEQLRHDFAPHFSAQWGDDRLVAPALAHYENQRGLKNELLIHVHFPRQASPGQRLHIDFTDALFHTGHHRFEFDTTQLYGAPKLTPRT